MFILRFHSQTTGRNINLMPILQRNQLRQHIGLYRIIAVDEHNKLAFSHIDTPISRHGGTTITYVLHSYAIILSRVLIANLTTFIRAPVINEQYLKVPERLRQDTVHAFPEVLLRFIHRYYH